MEIKRRAAGTLSGVLWSTLPHYSEGRPKARILYGLAHLRGMPEPFREDTP